VERDEAVVRVRDTGVGIAPKLLKRAFDLLVQADETLDRSNGGMGVGLTLVRAIVELHSGKVIAHSAGHGLGSEFVICLPLAAAGSNQAAVEPVTNGFEKTRRVLVIEDDPDIRESLRSILTLDGYQVTTAGDALSALAALECGPLVDVALVDIGIPGLSGYDLARKIRERWADRLRLIALTGYGRPGDREAAFRVGFDDHITKPFHPRELSALLQSDARQPASAVGSCSGNSGNSARILLDN